MVESKPRIKPPTYIPPKKKKKKIRWTYPNSIFSKWQSGKKEYSFINPFIYFIFYNSTASVFTISVT